jgi:phosphate transport system substrate-binding protein
LTKHVDSGPDLWGRSTISHEGNAVKLKRHGLIAGIALTAATLALAGCGSDNNSDSPSSGSNSSSAAAKPDCATGSLNSQGSTAQKNAMDEWIKDYQAACSGATINYQGTGSGAGVTAFNSNSADFVGSDSALKDGDETTKATARCAGNTPLNLPMVVGPIAVVYNLQGVTNLQLKPATLAGIFAGTIKTWDDPAIKADNSSAQLPSSPISTVHRSDDSGTTDNFTNYLKGASGGAWTFDHNKTWKAPGGQAAKGSDGIATIIKSTPGTISYVEMSFAQNSSLNTAKVQNGAGEWAELSDTAAAKAVAGAKIVGTGDDLKMQIDYTTKEAGAYPIVLVTYEIVCSKGNDAAKVQLIKDFLKYTSSTDGQAILSKNGYAPLPDSVRTKVAASVGNLA